MCNQAYHFAVGFFFGAVNLVGKAFNQYEGAPEAHFHKP